MKKAKSTTLIIIFSLLTIASAIAQSSSFQIILHSVLGRPKQDQLAHDVELYLSVLNQANNPIEDLTEKNFTIFEDGHQVDITSVGLVQDDEPIHVVIALDISGSMGDNYGWKMDAAKEAAKEFVRGLNEFDKASIITFNNQVTVVKEFSANHEILLSHISTINYIPMSNTSLYDAAVEALNQTSLIPPGRKAIILLTDGEDTTSNFSIQDVIDLATTESDTVPIYTFGLGYSTLYDLQELQRISARTNGKTFESPSKEDLVNAFLLLLDQLRSQYKISFTSAAGPGFHKIITQFNLGEQTFTSNSIDALYPEFPFRIEISQPSPGEEISSTTKITTTITGQGEPVSNVAFLINGTVAGTDETFPYSFNYDFSQQKAGEIIIKVIAQDKSGVELGSDETTALVLERPYSETLVPTSTSIPIEPTTTPKLLELATNPPGIYLTILLFILLIALLLIILLRKPKMRQIATISNSSGNFKGNEFMEPYALLRITFSDDDSMIGQEYRFSKDQIYIGRGADCDVIFTDNPVSRKHALIEIIEGNIQINDFGSSYGTFVNGKQIKKKPVFLASGDEVQFGSRAKTVFELLNADDDDDSMKTFDNLEIVPLKEDESVPDATVEMPEDESTVEMVSEDEPEQDHTVEMPENEPTAEFVHEEDEDYNPDHTAEMGLDEENDNSGGDDEI